MYITTLISKGLQMVKWKYKRAYMVNTIEIGALLVTPALLGLYATLDAAHFVALAIIYKSASYYFANLNIEMLSVQRILRLLKAVFVLDLPTLLGNTVVGLLRPSNERKGYLNSYDDLIADEKAKYEDALAKSNDNDY